MRVSVKINFSFIGCCIFHKQHKFAESDSDESDSDVEVAERSEPKQSGIKPYQRHHA